MKAIERKEWEKISRQNRIIEFAKEIFDDYGYDGATMDMIAKKAGYTKRNLYLYFKDKNEIFFAVTLIALNELNIRLNKVYSDSLSGHKNVIGISKTFFQYFMDSRKSFERIISFDLKHFYCSGTKEPQESEEFAYKAQEMHKKNLGLLLKAIECGIQDKSICTDISPKQLLLIIWGQNLGIIHTISVRFDSLGAMYNLTAPMIFTNYLLMINNCLQCEINRDQSIELLDNK